MLEIKVRWWNSAAAFLLLTLGTAACRREAAAAQKASDAVSPSGSKAQIVAYLGSEPITLAQVEAPIAHDVYAMRTTALHALLARRLVTDEARRRGITP
jgi:hypothetical protein